MGVGLTCWLGLATACMPNLYEYDYPLAVRLTPSPQPISARQQLVGEWQMANPYSRSGSTSGMPRWIFTADGRFTALDVAGANTSFALVGRYTLDASTEPMQLTLQLRGEQEAMQAIAEFTADGKLRLQTSAGGQSQPTDFTAQAIVLDKLSDSSEVPSTAKTPAPAVELPPPSHPAQARQTISAINRAQQAHYLEKGRFTGNVRELGVFVHLENQPYRYQIQLDSSGKQVSIAATPKTDGLRSYRGAVASASEDRGTVAIICQSNRPSATPPTVTRLGNNLRCGANSSSL